MYQKPTLFYNKTWNCQTPDRQGSNISSVRSRFEVASKRLRVFTKRQRNHIGSTLTLVWHGYKKNP